MLVQYCLHISVSRADYLVLDNQRAQPWGQPILCLLLVINFLQLSITQEIFFICIGSVNSCWDCSGLLKTPYCGVWLPWHFQERNPHELAGPLPLTVFLLLSTMFSESWELFCGLHFDQCGFLQWSLLQNETSLIEQ